MMNFKLRLKKIILSTLLLTVASLVVFATSALAANQCGKVFDSAQRVSVEPINAEIVNKILIETIENHGNYTSRFTVNSSEALELGAQWMGSGYKQIGKSDSGVFVSADGKRRFRIDNNSLMGTHSPHKPHVHLELVNPITTVVISNNHIILD
ncbi:hypothetical protein ACLSU7_02555 [Bdellovibrio sp. HCB185ZH]|uniref:hypothetical protein n=1 Tax=Bdellovibrio sp. HCB185ZH TaxID=3394235 RepID=UPI0039A4A5F4